LLATQAHYLLLSLEVIVVLLLDLTFRLAHLIFGFLFTLSHSFKVYFDHLVVLLVVPIFLQSLLDSLLFLFGKLVHIIEFDVPALPLPIVSEDDAAVDLSYFGSIVCFSVSEELLHHFFVCTANLFVLALHYESL